MTHTGGNIIKTALHMLERLGRPLELDTDGIWQVRPSHLYSIPSRMHELWFSEVGFDPFTHVCICVYVCVVGAAEIVPGEL